VRWKFGLSLLLIAAAAALAALGGISSIAGSDSCGGCDTTPAWVDPVMAISGAALVVWVAAAVYVIARGAVRASRARRPSS
jgi:hypothetical protein